MPNKEKSKLDEFRAEVARLKKEEEESLDDKGIKKTAHFDVLNPDELDESDRLIYEMLLAKQLTVKAFNIYQSQLQKSGNRSQREFAAYIANKLFIQMHKDK